MSIPVIVMGATGRMGATVARMVRESADLHLAGAVERPERLEEACLLGCPASGDVAGLLLSLPGAVIIDFTAPEASMATAEKAAAHGAAHVIGTTGLSEAQKARLAELAQKTPLFWAANMSVGIGVLARVLPELIRLLGPEYDAEIMEIHHARKKDSPSGTALRLAEAVAEAKGWSLDKTARYHREDIIGERPKEEIGIQALRGGDVVGVHTVYLMGPGERIEVTHQAHSRENFAAGALRAARWLHGRAPGRLYSIQDILFDEDSHTAK